jgi:hypothetical protein
LPKLHGGKRGDKAFLRSVRRCSAVAMPGLRFPERAQRAVLWRLWKAPFVARKGKGPTIVPITIKSGNCDFDFVTKRIISETS